MGFTSLGIKSDHCPFGLYLLYSLDIIPHREYGYINEQVWIYLKTKFDRCFFFYAEVKKIMKFEIISRNKG